MKTEFGRRAFSSVVHKSGTKYLLPLELHHHPTVSKTTLKLIISPLREIPTHLATPCTSELSLVLTLVRIYCITLLHLHLRSPLRVTGKTYRQWENWRWSPKAEDTICITQNSICKCKRKKKDVCSVIRRNKLISLPVCCHRWAYSFSPKIPRCPAV